jgi:hypothetical protein
MPNDFLTTDDVYEVFCKRSSIHLDLTNVHQICVPIGCIFVTTGPNDLLQSINDVCEVFYNNP